MNTELPRLSLPLLALALSPALAAAGPAGVMIAADQVSAQTNAPSIVVNYSDLDLSTPQGRQELHKRIERAAYKVCRDMVGRPSIQYAMCRDQLVQAAVQDVNNKLRLAGLDNQILR